MLHSLISPVLSANGDFLWSAILDGADPMVKAEVFDFVADQNGSGQTTGFTLCGFFRELQRLLYPSDRYRWKSNRFLIPMAMPLSDQFNSIQKKEDGTYILGGFTDLTPTKGLPTISHVAANGDFNLATNLK